MPARARWSIITWRSAAATIAPGAVPAPRALLKCVSTSAVRPAKAGTVFAGGDEEAVAHLRSLLSDYPPSSPSIALFREGKPVYMLHRSVIERSEPAEIAKLLTDAFEQFC